MPEPHAAALTRIRALLLDPERLVRAVAGGRRRGATPAVVRAELRPVELRTGLHVQVITSDGSRPVTRNLTSGPTLESTVDELLAEPFGNWRVETVAETLQMRVTKRGEAQVHVAAARPTLKESPGQHDRPAAHLLAPDDPLFDVIGGTAAKRRQVDAFLRALIATIDVAGWRGPFRVVDLGCGNAYLTFAAYRYLDSLGLDLLVTGVDVRADQRERNTLRAEKLGWAPRVTFVAGTIADAPVDAADLVLALHACDTATDEALARAVGWRSRWVLAAPCCHHDVAAQLRGTATPAPYELLTRHGILRERFADVLTDALRAALLRLHGYRVEVVEFIDSTHTPRNLLLRAARSGAPPTNAQCAEYADLTTTWNVTPRLQSLLSQGLSTSAPGLSTSAPQSQSQSRADTGGSEKDPADDPADR